MTNYTIRGGSEGRERLRVLARVLQPYTLRLFNNIGLTSGMSCLDLGCGGGDVALLLAQMVGPTGSVVGIDRDDVKIQIAQQEAQDRLAHVVFRAGDVYDLADEARYDLVYARFLLSHLREPQVVVEKIWRALKPNGVMVIEDIEHSGVFCYPHSDAFIAYDRLFNQTVRANGGDPDIGPKLPALIREASAQIANVELVQPIFVIGEGKSIASLTLASMSEAISAAGFATQHEIDTLVADIDAFAGESHTLISLPRIYQVWARRG